MDNSELDLENEGSSQRKKIKLDTDQDKDGMINFSEDVSEMQDDDFTVRDDIYSNYPNPEELEKLREFKVLDEVKSNDEDSQDESDSSDGKSEGLPEEEIEKMLDEDLPDELKAAPKPKEKPYVTRQKIVLEEKGVNHLEVLPLDWMMARHYSGMPVYIHRTSRVCTLSKPYFLGKGNTRRHEIPISAIPCLAYRKALEEEAKQEEIDRNIQEQIKDGTWKDYAPKTDLNIKENETKKYTNNVKDDKPSELPASDEIDDKKIDENNVSNASENIKTKCPFSHENLVQFTTNDINTDNIDDKNVNNIPEVDQIDGENRENGEKNKSGVENGDNKEDESKIEKATAVTNLDDIPLNRRPVVLPGGIVMPPPRVETVNDSWKTQHLNHEQVNDYCKKLFKFKVVNIMHFNRWADRRKYTKARKTLQYPTLPEGTKLITIPAQNGQDGTGKAAKRDWVMNMNGRSCLSVFHEYVRRALQKQPVYEFKQLENASCPYQASVYIGGMQYGVGRGSSKRQAKSHAARHAFHVLLPTLQAQEPTQPPEPDFTFFDYVGIEDPRISEFCAATCEPSPHAILRTCLLRNFGAGDRHIHTEMKKLEYQKIELTMSVGKHKATVVCKNKKTAKQRASQAILQALHPHVTSWGSLLRLYGSRSVKSCKEKKLEEQQITLLQDKAQHNEPNYAVLDKLRTEMRRLKERDAAIVPIGTLLLQHDLPSHSGSNLNNVDL